MKKSTANNSSLPKLNIEAPLEESSDAKVVSQLSASASQVIPEILTNLTSKRSVLKSNLRAYEAEPVKLTPGLDPTQLSSDGKEVAGRSVKFLSVDQIFRASEDDQIIRRGIDQLHFVLPLNSPLLRPSETTSTSTENPMTSDLNRFQSTPPLTAQSAGAPAMNSPYTRMCDLLEHFVDAETEVTDELLFNRPLMKERNGSVDLSPELDHFNLSNSNIGGGGSSGINVINPNGNSAIIINAPSLNTSNSTNSESRSLWLGNVDPTVTEEEIRQAFSPFGVIETVRLLPAKECAFVNYFELESAIRGRNAMQGKPLGNMILRIGFGKISDTNSNTSNNTANSSSLTFNYSSFGGGSNNNNNNNVSAASRSVWIGNVGPEITADLLMYHFNAFGPIESCRVLETKNCAFVNYYSAEAAAAAKQKMNGVLIGESVIKTGHARDNSNNNNTNNNNNGSYNINGAIISHEPILSIMKGVVGGGGGKENSNSTGKPKMTFASIMADEEEESAIENGNENRAGFDGVQLREFRRIVEGMPEEIPKILETLMSQGDLYDLSIDSYGNILLQKMIERAEPREQEIILKAIRGRLAEIAMHKNGTWVVQKLITSSRIHDLEVIEELKERTVELIEDQFGNYVIQCILKEEPGDNSNGIVERIVMNCKRLALGKFSSRALRSILESSTSVARQKQIASALAKESVLLSVDPNGAVVIQWILDSDLPGKVALVTGQLQGRLSQIALTKQGGVIVARIIACSEEPKYRDAAILELYELPSDDSIITPPAPQNDQNQSLLDALLNEPATCSILYKAFQVSKPAIRLRLAQKLRPKLIRTIQDLLGREDVENFSEAEIDKILPVHLTKLYQEFIIMK